MVCYETCEATPVADSMIETFRAVGYSFETAVADIMDNSISAGAENIWVNYEWKGESTVFYIRDDGTGMDNNEVVQAMRPGSRHPNAQRDTQDLGRFGLGLKTASFSQTRKFSLISKKNKFNPVFWSWDLDYVNKTKLWTLIKYIPDNKYLDEIENMESGTSIIWYELDRLLRNAAKNDNDTLNKFMELMEIVKEHLAMVFHRFIEQGRVNIHFQGRTLNAWDPYLRKENGIQPQPIEPLQNDQIAIQGYILPHKSKLSEKVFLSASGPKGWNEQQGFYIYRNDRLLVAGDWLGMFRKEEHYKLARIMIDLPNTLDNEWQIDIKKSIASPPFEIRNQIKSYAKSVRAGAVQVYRCKGKIIQRGLKSLEYVPVWFEKIRHGKRYYKLNKDHPIVKDYSEKINHRDLNKLLGFVEETVPVPLITIRENENPDSFGLPFEDAKDDFLRIKLEECFKQLIINKNSVEETCRKLMCIEPFDRYPELIEIMREKYVTES